MLTLNKTSSKNAFTIIEVVLVLAVASLIILIVLAAVPQLQKSRRDSKRKSDVAEIASYITEYATSTGSPPTSDLLSDALNGTSNGFSEYISNRDGDVVFQDPDSGEPYDHNSPYDSSSANAGEYGYETGHSCSDGNSDIESTGIANDFAMVIKLENGAYCVDNVI